MSRSRNKIKWNKLDNTANLFAVIAGESTTNVYRISAILNETIVPEKLQEALDILLPKMDGFNVRMRRGLFWYYFEENGKRAPKVVEENEFPCRQIKGNRNRNYLFRVTYYGCKINLEVLHVLTDGVGGIEFLRELVYQYLRLVHPGEEGMSESLRIGTSLNVEDSFVANYKSAQKNGFEQKKAYIVKAEKVPAGELGLMHMHMSVADVKAAAKAAGTSINNYLVAAFIWSIYKECLGGRPANRPICVAVPVNLRPYFDSVTSRNFFVMVSAKFEPESREYTFDEVVRIVSDELKSQINKEHLEDLFSYSVSNQVNPWLRIVPLGIKKLAIRAVYNRSADANTSTITNIGRIDVEEPYAKYVDGFHAFIPMSRGQNIKGTICSYGDDLVFTFSTVFADTRIERAMARLLCKRGVEVRIETNGVFDE